MAGWDKGGRGITQYDDPESHKYCARQSNLEKYPVNMYQVNMICSTQSGFVTERLRWLRAAAALLLAVMLLLTTDN